MKTIRYFLIGMVITGSLAASLHFLHAQTAVAGGFNGGIAPAQSVPDSIVQLTADAQGLALVPPDQVPRSGTFWLAMPGGILAPAPCPPLDPVLPIYFMANQQFLVDETGGQVILNNRLGASSTVESALEAQANSVVNLITRIQGTAMNQQMRISTGMSLNVPSFNDTGNGDGSPGFYSDSFFYTPPTNGLWLEITNIANGWSYLNLHNATNQVYAIWSTTNLLTAWNVETEVWPTDTNCMPFFVPTLARQDLFLRAQDWTGVSFNGLPCWWTWLYFGNLTESASDMDSQGQYTLGDDFNYGLDPNIISFSVRLGNRHFQTQQASGQYVVTAGMPSYEAVLVNGTNLNNAVWQPYDGIVSLPLGSTDGVYQVWMGLKGRAPSSTPTWIGTQVYLDRTPPILTITNPASGTVALPYIQLQGMANERLASVTYDVSNALGVATGQAGSVTGEYLDTNSLMFTTNYFQCYDVWLTNGVNVITVHATDESGNIGSTSISFTQNYSGKTAPVIQLDWPADGMQIAQSNITMRGTLSDPTASIALQVTDGAGNTNVIAGVVERDGHFWIQNVPLAGGTNEMILTAQDILNNPATMSLAVMENNIVGLTMNSVTSDLWESTATVSGTIGDPSTLVTVNGVTAVNDGYGGWTASNVPISDGNVAVFNAVATVGGGNMAMFHTAAMNSNNSQNTQAQLAQIKQAALKLVAATLSDERFDGRGGAEFGDDTTVWSWKAGKGGKYEETYHYWDTAGGNYTSWNNAPILADRSVPYEHFTDSYGADLTNYDSLTGGWQHDFAQEIGALLAISPEWGADFWEKKVGDASWILHAGNVSMAGAPNPDSLMVLSATAAEEVRGTGEQISGTIVAGPDELGPEIDNTGKQEDTNYQMALVMQDGTDKKSAITTDRPLASVANGPTDDKLGWVVVACSPPLNVSRTTIGIGEPVYFYMTGNLTVDWSVTGGGKLSLTNGSSTTFTAGFAPAISTVHAKFKDQELTQAVSVIAPSSITVVGLTNLPQGTENTNGTLMGAETDYSIVIGLTNVSFQNAPIRENPNPASMTVAWPNGTNATIYFSRSTNAYYLPCGGLKVDQITSVVVPTSYLFNGTNYVDFSYTSTWTDQYKNESGNWVDYFTKTAKYEFRASDKKCRITYLGVPGNWQGPY